MAKIFVYRPTAEYRDASGIAYAEDGTELAFHISSNLSFFRHDMGLAGDAGMGASKHRKYQEKYPDGFDLVEVIGRESLQKIIDSGELVGVSFDDDSDSQE